MENSKELLKQLEDKNPETVSKAIEEIRQSGDISIVSALLDILEEGTLSDNTNEDYNHNDESLLAVIADIKNVDIRNIIIEKLKVTKKQNFKIQLLRVCWESSQDYSTYSDVFINLLSDNNFEIAMEASTNLEELIHHLSQEERLDVANKLKKCSVPEANMFFIDNILAEMNSIEESAEESFE